MSIIITKENAASHRRELELAYRFRHEFFVDGLGWEALRKPDGREIDEFDTDDTVHVIDIVDGKPVFYTRFLRTTGPHLLSHFCPELLQGQPAPRHRSIWEQSRATILTRKPINGQIYPATVRSALSTIEAALFLGATHVVAETHPGFMTRCFELGYRPEPLAPIVEAFGQLIVVLKLTTDDHTLATVRRYFDHWTPVLLFNGRPALEQSRREAA